MLDASPLTLMPLVASVAPVSAMSAAPSPVDTKMEMPSDAPSSTRFDHSVRNTTPFWNSAPP